MEPKVFIGRRLLAGANPAHRLPFTHAIGNEGGPMTWIVIIALAIVSFGLVKARRNRKTATGTAHQ